MHSRRVIGPTMRLGESTVERNVDNDSDHPGARDSCERTEAAPRPARAFIGDAR